MSSLLSALRANNPCRYPAICCLSAAMVCPPAPLHASIISYPCQLRCVKSQTGRSWAWRLLIADDKRKQNGGIIANGHKSSEMDRTRRASDNGSDEQHGGRLLIVC